MSEPETTEAEDIPVLDPEAERKQLRRVRLFGLIQSAVAMLMSLMLCAGRILAPSEAVTFLGALYLLIVLPSLVCAFALTLYHAKKTDRPAGSWSGELAFWSVAPATAGILLYGF